MSDYCILTLFLICPKLFCVPIIQLSLIPTDDVYQKRIEEKLDNVIETGKENPIEAGHIATYGGYVEVSDHNGLISFPRKQADKSIHLLITQEANPISMFHNTLAYWEITPDIAARFYHIEQHYNEKTKKSSWNTKEVPLPDDHKIPFDTIILFIDPEYANPTLEEIIAFDNENLLMPPIQIKKRADEAKNAIIFLKVRHLFRTPEPAVNKQAHRYEISLTP